jgi:DNA-binding LacI/PurR family transcriptional regulator
VLQEAERMASTLRYGLLVMNTDTDDDQLYWAVRESVARSVDGIILCLGIEDDRTTKLLKEIIANGIRCIALFNDVDGVPSLSVDYEQAGRLAAEHLYSLDRKKCLYVHDAPNMRDQFTGWRWSGFSFLADEKSDFEAQDAHLPYGSAEFADSGISLKNYNGVFCQNDRCLTDIYRIAAKMHLRIPEDLAVVGCNNRNISSQLVPSATTIDIRKADIGKQAVQRLIFTKPTYPVRGKIFQPELLVRESSRI